MADDRIALPNKHCTLRVSFNSFLSKQPGSVGDIVSLYAEIVRVGTTSITVKVEVYAERNYAAPIIVKVTEAELTYVAIDGEGIKRAVPPEKMPKMD